MARPKKLQQSVPRLWEVYRRFWPWIRKQRAQMAISVSALFAGVLLAVLEPLPLKIVFDRVIPVSTPDGLTAGTLFDSLDSATLLALAAIAIILINGLKALAGYVQAVGFARVGIRVLRDVRNHVYRHVQALPLAFHTRARSGDLIVRLTRDVSMLRDVTSTAVLPVVANVFVIFGMLLVMLWLQWKLALVAVATLPLFWLTTVRLGRRIHQAARKQRRREGAMASVASESMTAIRSVQALSLEDVFAEEFSASNNKSQKEELKAARLSARLGRTVDVLLAIATAVVVWYGARLVQSGAMTPGDLLVFLTYLKRSFKPAKDFAKYTGRLAKATAAGERVVELLDRTSEIQDDANAVTAPELRGHVRFEHVDFAYEPGHPVLQEIDIDIRPGMHVALTGPSGAGKSTLTGMILRQYDPIAGRVLIDSHDIRDFTIASLRSQISIVLQDTILFANSVRENIAYGAPGATVEEIESAARLANAHEFIQQLPDGYDTQLGERGSTLSQGQRQRIAIARAALKRSPVLILDEPTTGLDEENERTVIEALDRLAAARTTFLVTHNLRFAASADVILHCEHGRIIEQGTHSELIQRKGRYAALYASQNSTTHTDVQERRRELIP